MEVRSMKAMQIETMSQLQEAIALQYPGLTAHEQKVGAFIVENPTKVALLSMRKLADAAAVSSYTVIRFFKKFGFEKFHDIKILASQALVVDPLSVLERTCEDIVQKNTTELGNIHATQINLILNAIKHPAPQELDRLAKILMSSKVNYVVGFGASQALTEHFHLTFSR
jgi:RpiR family carbohydrate utilization transcriptional regulator